MVTLKRTLILGALATSLVFFAAACDDDAESTDTASQGSVEQLTASVGELRTDLQNDEMLQAVLAFGTLELHDMDVELNEGGEIQSSYASNTRKAWRVIVATNWHDDVAEKAKMTQDEAASLLVALDANDRDAAAEHATALHDAYHDLEHDVWAILTEGVEDPVDSGHGEGEESENGGDHGDEAEESADGAEGDGASH